MWSLWCSAIATYAELVPDELAGLAYSNCSKPNFLLTDGSVLEQLN